MRKEAFAKKSLGQNFLIDRTVIRRIHEAVDPEPADLVFEIGPGRGALTDGLVASGAKIIAIELDRELVPLLREQFAESSNFSVIEANALTVDFHELIEKTSPGKTAKLAANLPYYISTAILQRLIEQRECFSQMVLMFQREVVDRIAAKPGDSERGFLSVLCEAFLRVEKLFDVPPEAFKPRPKIWSSVVRLVPIESEVQDAEAFRRIVSASFSQRRKTILNNLRPVVPNAAAVLEHAGIDPSRRAETISKDEWLRLLGAIPGR